MHHHLSRFRPTVASLLLRSSPLAVSLAVAGVVILALESGPNRTHSHIGKEVLEGIRPAGANQYSSPSVVLKAGRPRIIAAIEHHAI